MSTLEEVRTAEKRVQEILQRLLKAGAADPENLTEQLLKATDVYTNAARQLKVDKQIPTGL